MIEISDASIFINYRKTKDTTEEENLFVLAMDGINVTVNNHVDFAVALHLEFHALTLRINHLNKIADEELMLEIAQLEIIIKDII